MLINAQSMERFFDNARVFYEDGVKMATDEHTQVAMQVMSSTSSERYGWLADMPQIREWLDERYIKRLRGHQYTVLNKDFELTVSVNRNDLDDDALGIYGPMFKELGRLGKDFPNELIFNLLRNGDTELCYDGQPFFDADHPVLDAAGNEQSYSNDDGGAGAAWYLLDTSRAIKPLLLQTRKEFQLTRMDAPTDVNVWNRKEYQYGIDGRMNAGYGLWQLARRSRQPLNKDNFTDTYQKMRAFRGDGGDRWNLRPTLLVVPTTLWGTAKDLVESERLANGASNTIHNQVAVLTSQYVDA